jgi:hypothetical protein
MSPSKLCTFPGCDKPSNAQGYCGKHYEHLKRRGMITLKRKIPKHGTQLVWLKEHMWDGSPDGPCVIWPFYRGGKHGYAIINYCGKQQLATRVVCKFAHGLPPTPDHEAAHECGKGHEGCISAHHLTWKTHAENEGDKLRHGTHNRGERQGRSRLKEADVHEIRRLVGGGMIYREAADLFGVSAGTIGDIFCGRTWDWLK